MNNVAKEHISGDALAFTVFKVLDEETSAPERLLAADARELLVYLVLLNCR